MPIAKFTAGEAAEVSCHYLRGGEHVHGWLRGEVVQADYRMAAVKFDTTVFTSDGQVVPDSILWCAHGSRNIRRPSTESS